MNELMHLFACTMFVMVSSGSSARSLHDVSYLPADPYTTVSSNAYVSPKTTPARSREPYLVTAPKTARPGFNFSLVVDLFVDRSVELSARMYSYRYNFYETLEQNIVRASGSYVRGRPTVIDLPVPSNLESGSYNWEVVCNDCSFPYRLCQGCSEHPSRVYDGMAIVYDVTTILVQTDKAIYMPGQIASSYFGFADAEDFLLHGNNYVLDFTAGCHTIRYKERKLVFIYINAVVGGMVHYRVFAVYQDLRMYTGSFQIEIEDPNGNKIQQLFQVVGLQGVVEGSLALADQTVFGDWKITALIQTFSRDNSFSKKFTVAEYSLPRFEVKVNILSYALTSDEYLTGSIKASYTFGQPVKGMVELHVSSTEETYSACRSQPLFVQMAFDIDGEAKFSVPNVDIRRFMNTTEGAQVTVKAIVKEARTDVHLEGSTNVTYRDSPYKVKILDNTPSVFKPGLPFDVFVKVSMQDDSPVLGENSVTVLGIGTYSIPVNNSYLYGTSQFTGSYPLGVRTIDVPPSGVVRVDVDIPFNVSEIKVIVYFKDLSTVQTASKLFSPSNNYLQLTVLDQFLKSGQTVHVRAQATENIGDLRYEILSRGVVCGSGVVDAKNQTEVTIDIPLTFKMAPTTHMTAYYMHSQREVVADSIAFNVDGIFQNEVSLEMSVNRTEPHTDLEVYVTADPNSVVHLLAVDQSVLLIKTGNDVTPSQIADGVAKHDVGSKPSDSAFALSLSGTNTQETLQAVGLDVYSNMNLYTSQQPTIQEPYDATIYGPTILAVKPTTQPEIYYTGPTPLPYYSMEGPIPYPPFYTGETPLAYPPMFTAESPFDTSEHNLKEVTRVRSLFPETWLWLNQSVGVNGTTVIRTTVPDTITSWVTTAFATNLDSGFGIVPQASKLTVFRSFFVSLNMPTSVIRGEYVVIQAGIFNYLPINTTVLVTLPASHEYMNVVIDSDGNEILTSEDQKQVIQISSNEQAVVYFPIVPSGLGAVDIEVSARSTMAADAERRQLHVQAEGVPNEFSVPVFIHLDPTTTNSFTKSFNITLPSDIVEGSSRASIRVTGDILGPSIDGLESLLRMPTGCGEQNMILMAPHVYIYTLLTSTRQITPELDARLKYFMERGYQRELTYQRQDGSFSSFGDHDSAGSTWLTAFVLRVFHQARRIIFVDKHALQRAAYWLIQHQNADGSFNEFGHVYDAQMGSFGDHSPGLTAFVLLALTENTDIDWMTDTHDKYHEAIASATNFLYMSFDSIHDELSLVLTCYVLLGMPNPSDLNYKILTVLKTRVFRNNEIVLGKANQTNQVNSYSRWGTGYTRARPIDIQLTSYALLTFTTKGLFQEGLKLLSWLTHQRNPYGGFVSTQDTIVALQAMTEFVKHYAPSGYDMHVLVRTEQSPFHFEVNMNNSQVLQSHGVSYIPKELTFEATGHGLVVAELDVFFNAESDFGESAFDVSTVLLDDYLNSFKLMICTRYRLAGESGMVVQEVGIPSGFAPDVTSIGNVAGLKRVEQRGRFLDVYIDTVGRNSMCYTVMFDRRDKVAHSQTSYVITQEYYEPGNRAVVGYQPVSLRDATVCDVCQDCC